MRVDHACGSHSARAGQYVPKTLRTGADAGLAPSELARTLTRNIGVRFFCFSLKSMSELSSLDFGLRNSKVNEICHMLEIGVRACKFALFCAGLPDEERSRDRSCCLQRFAAVVRAVFYHGKVWLLGQAPSEHRAGHDTSDAEKSCHVSSAVHAKGWR